MKVTVKLNTANIKNIEKAVARNLTKTADALKTDLQQSETMPFKTGQLQNRSTFVDDKEAETGKVYIVSDTPYARRLYFHPEYNFSRAETREAGGGVPGGHATHPAGSPPAASCNTQGQRAYTNPAGPAPACRCI